MRDDAAGMRSSVKIGELLGFSPGEFSLPINAAVNNGQRSHLIVLIPDNFKLITDKKNMPANMLEFIPKTENDYYRWGEIITISTYLDKRINAVQAVSNLKQFFLKDPTTQIIEEHSDYHETYQEASFIMTYIEKNRKEVAFVEYFSGPYDCAGAQYSIALDDSMELEEAITKIKKFVNENTRVLFF
jgi:hypothetical protein